MRKFFRWLRLGFVLGGSALIVVSLVYFFTQGPPSKLLSPVPDGQSVFSFFAREKNSEELKEKIQDLVGNKLKNYSVLVEDYSSNFRMDLGGDVIYTAASVNKVPILASLYYYNQTGDVDLNRIITLQQSDIQDYGTGTIRYDPPGSTYSVKTLARLMMQISDNTAAYLLGNYVMSLDKIQGLMDQWGLTQTDMANNQTSNSDMAILFRKIFSEKVANHALTAEMLSFMKDTEQEDRLPALLPKGVLVYHKIGNAANGLHDVGIVENGSTNYYIGIFTADIQDVNSTTKLIAEISKTVYNYMR